MSLLGLVMISFLSYMTCDVVKTVYNKNKNRYWGK